MSGLVVRASCSRMPTGRQWDIEPKTFRLGVEHHKPLDTRLDYPAVNHRIRVQTETLKQEVREVVG